MDQDADEKTPFSRLVMAVPFVGKVHGHVISVLGVLGVCTNGGFPKFGIPEIIESQPLVN